MPSSAWSTGRTKYKFPALLNLYCRRCDRQHRFRWDKQDEQYVSMIPAVKAVCLPESLIGLLEPAPDQGCGTVVHMGNILLMYAVDEFDGTIYVPDHMRA